MSSPVTMVSNLTQVGELNGFLKVPSMSVCLMSYLMEQMIVKEEVKGILSECDEGLVNDVVEMVEGVDVSYLRVRKMEIEKNKVVDSEMLRRILSVKPDLFGIDDGLFGMNKVEIPIVQKLEMDGVVNIAKGDIQRMDLILDPDKINDYESVPFVPKKKSHGKIIKAPEFDKMKKFYELAQMIIDWDDKLRITLPNDLLSQIYFEIAKLSKENVISHISSNMLSDVIKMLTLQISNSSKIQYSSLDMSKKHLLKEQFFSIIAGLDSGLIILHYMASDAKDSIIKEESLVLLISFCTLLLKHIVFPTSEKKDQNNDIKEILKKLNDIFDLLEFIVRTKSLPESVIFEITTLVTPLFSKKNIYSTQVFSVNLLRSIFSRYPSTRSIILEDIFTDLYLTSSQKKVTRNYKLSNSNSVQVTTILILELIQSCSGLPLNEDSITSKSSYYTNSYSSAINYTKIYLQHFQNVQTRNQEYQEVFSNFIHDLLILLNLPAWPSAETFLSFIIKYLTENAVDNDQKDSMRIHCIQLLGNIATRVRKDFVMANASTILISPQVNEEEDSSSCLCGSAYDEAPRAMLDCDRCRRWFHHDCVGFNPTSSVSQWYCDQCLILKQVQQHNNSLSELSSQNELEDDMFDQKIDLSDTRTIVVRQLILNYLSIQSRVNNTSNYAREFLLSRWSYNETNPSRYAYYLSQWNLDSHSVELDKLPILSPVGINQLILSLVSKNSLMMSFNILLAAILSVLEEKSVRMKTTALRSLGSIIEADPEILVHPKVQQILYLKFSDSSILVRDAVLILIGRFITSNPLHANKYYGLISDRIKDPGISVRKRVVKISTKLIENDPFGKLSKSICINLSFRLNDSEESIRKMSFDSLKDIWFLSQKIENDNSDIKMKVAQIISVVKAFNFANLEWFKELLLKAKEESSRKNIRRICKKMVICLIDKLIEHQEIHDDTPHEQQKESLNFLNATVTLLTLFAETYPKLLCPYSDTLLTYLISKKTDAQNSILHKNIAYIFANTISHISWPGYEFIDALIKNLSGLIYTSGMPVIEACCFCLAKICEKNPDRQSVLKSHYNTFVTYLGKVPNKRQLHQPNIKLAIIRSLYVVANLIRFHNFDNDREINFLKLSEVEYGETVENYYDEIEDFLPSASDSIRAVCIKSLGVIVSYYPALLLRNENLLENGLKVDSSAVIKSEILTLLYNLLLEEENRMNELTVEVDILDHGKEGISIGIIHKHLSQIVDCFHEKSLSLRKQALSIVSYLIENSLIHPIVVIENLIALSMDPEHSISEKAYSNLSMVSQSEQTIILSRMKKGIKLAYQHQLAVYQNPQSFCLTKNVSYKISILNRLYNVVKDKKTSRNALFQSCLSIVESQIDPKLVEYIVLALCTLKYSFQEEVLFIIVQINEMSSFFGATLLGSLSKNTKELDLSKIACSFGVTMLIRMKKFLKSFYGISNNKCQTFSKTDSKNTPVSSKMPVELSNITAELSLDNLVYKIPNWSDNPSLLLEQYYLFKSEMENDDMDYTEQKSKRKLTKSPNNPRPTKRQRTD